MVSTPTTIRLVKPPNYDKYSHIFPLIVWTMIILIEIHKIAYAIAAHLYEIIFSEPFDV